MTDIGAGPILARVPANDAVGQRLLCPFTLQVWAVDRMLNLEIVDDPTTRGWSCRCSTTQPMAEGWPCCSGGEWMDGWTSTGNPA
jgi:hypothetical protein